MLIVFKAILNEVDVKVILVEGFQGSLVDGNFVLSENESSLQLKVLFIEIGGHPLMFENVLDGKSEVGVNI